jgi:hypothetical protein
VLIEEKLDCLQNTVEAATKRKSCKRQYVQVEESLTVSEVLDLIAKREGSSCNNSKTPAKRVRAKRHCGCCSEVRHNSCTCKVEIEDVDNSEESEI